MLKLKKIIIYFFALIFLFSYTGCAALQRKFVRKKKEEKKIAPVITTYDYSKKLRVDELYKKHFLFWKSWQSELIDRLNATYKKRVGCYDRLSMELAEMRKYLTGVKADELDGFIKQIRSVDSTIRKKRLSKSERFRVRRLLEMTLRQIDKRFAYSDVKDYLELRQ